MARSMTGFGMGQAPLAGGQLAVEVRSVNHRFLDLRLSFASELLCIALQAEQRLRAKLQRGRFDVSCRLGGGGETRGLDRDRARAAFLALSELRDELAPGAELPLSVLGAIPDLFRAPAVADKDTLLACFDSAAGAALAELGAMRETEGRALVRAMRDQLRVAHACRVAILREASTVVEDQRRRLRERIGRLLDADVAIDPGRLEMEVVLFADRCDVSEELARLACHFDQLDGTLDGDGPIGRKIDFLMQEIVREANTIGSKSQSAAIAHQVVELKSAIERMREQAQNIE